ncbi:MAG: hypothetical protein SPE79_00180, partial [Sodaliphilus sp.]|nr:hypothetical protein [Sodaliphilus sp.]
HNSNVAHFISLHIKNISSKIISLQNVIPHSGPSLALLFSTFLQRLYIYGDKVTKYMVTKVLKNDDMRAITTAETKKCNFI